MGIYEYSNTTILLSVVQIVVLAIIVVNTLGLAGKVEAIAQKLGAIPTPPQANNVATTNNEQSKAAPVVDNPGLKGMNK